MGRVLTLHKILEFPETLETTIVGQERVQIEGDTADAETRIYAADENDVPDFNKFIIRHNQKYSIEGKVWNRQFKEILRTIQISVYKRDSKDTQFILPIGNSKGSYAIASFKRLRKSTAVKCDEVKIDLIEAVETIIKSDAGIEISSGWFSNIGLPNLNNALLQGAEANLGAAWNEYKQRDGATLSNVELAIEDDDFENGYVKLSLSKRGIIFSKKNIPDKKLLELAERIIELLF
ncbi:hypothetical protein PNF29_18700 [Bacillus subtilis]|uniref:hypothetical protein n=1 Tax=Bacillus subtilis group TaxID=653685 RepID=UPI00228226C4|nr:MULTISPECIES: hypothetical protein [Bacillus subtilis group]MCY9028889.1 hypothetical protein [Bacillus inaquosorum]WCL62511.1 hypothetical protein PNF29_18700 [Bacillus subtilis]